MAPSAQKKEHHQDRWCSFAAEVRQLLPAGTQICKNRLRDGRLSAIIVLS